MSPNQACQPSRWAVTFVSRCAWPGAAALLGRIKREGCQFVLSEWSSKARSRKRLVKKIVATVLWMIASQIDGLVA